MRSDDLNCKAVAAKVEATSQTICHPDALGNLPFHDVYGLRSFIALGDFKIDILAFVEGFKSIPLNRAVMNKHITAAFFFDKAVTFCVIKPFDLPRCHETSCARYSGALYHGAMTYISSSLQHWRKAGSPLTLM